MENKTCTKCNINKSISEFSLEKKHKDGYSYYCKSCRKEYKVKNKEKIKLQNKEYFQKNKAIKQINRKEYDKLNREQINKYKREYRKTVLLQNPLYICSQAIRDSIRHGIKNRGFRKTAKACEILGCSFEKFKQYLESLWESWMNWENYGNPKDGIYVPNKTWDLDHKTPISSAITEDDVIRLNHYTNFQPLCSYYNRFIKKAVIISS